MSNTALDSKMKDIQCREIEAMSTPEVTSFAATIAKHLGEHSTTVMLATAVRALGATMPKEEPQLQRRQQPPAPQQEQDIGHTTLNGSCRQGIERRQELAHVECQNGFSGFDELTDRTDELRAEQHRLDNQAYIRRGGCKGCHGRKYSEETGFCEDCMYCTSCCHQRFQTEPGEGSCGQQNLDVPEYDLCDNCDRCWRCCV